jgi:heme exporter protein B
MLEASRKPTFAIPAPHAEGGFAASLAQAFAVAAKDVRMELRSRESAGGSLVFALLVLVIFNFAFDLEGEMAEIAGPGILWVAIVLAGMMGLGYVFAKERDQGALQGLLLTPIDRSAIFLGKVMGALLLTFALELFLLPIFAVFANVSILSPGLILIVILGTLGFVTVGTLFSAMAVTSRSRELLLPLLLLPVAAPVVIAAVEGTRSALEGGSLGDQMSALSVLAAFDVVFLGLCPFLFEYVMEEMAA